MLGESSEFKHTLELLRQVAIYDAAVLLEGETGTGKELAARAIHYDGPRRGKPFLPVNCGALPDSLVENELFGHCRGAYTAAHRDESGMIGAANGGTLFLDEVDSLSPKAQGRAANPAPKRSGQRTAPRRPSGEPAHQRLAPME